MKFAEYSESGNLKHRSVREGKWWGVQVDGSVIYWMDIWVIPNDELHIWVIPSNYVFRTSPLQSWRNASIACVITYGEIESKTLRLLSLEQRIRYLCINMDTLLHLFPITTCPQQSLYSSSDSFHRIRIGATCPGNAWSISVIWDLWHRRITWTI